ncbi:shikimate kinase [Chitinivibrio alkaliphilus]|uniref:Shikimate kinase n=1 Tax=Chitinivibrio alkaliphilus ACht1 TaxID=1313304 RepID=U7DBG7_9BACT|nr:shikimate kinase [Chitinivibrio alkaliphilus]ERP31770.1 Shikimate kinase [Chitinivibrio alkaliphilus ACht1]
MKRILITGPKASGKSNIGNRLAELLHVDFYDLDNMIETLFRKEKGARLNFREIYRRHGEAVFRDYEIRSAREIAHKSPVVLSTGGTSFLLSEIREIFSKDTYVILLKNDYEVLWERVAKNGTPAYLEDVEEPKRTFFNRVDKVIEAIEPDADIVFDTNDLSIEDVAQMLDMELDRRGISLRE